MILTGDDTPLFSAITLSQAAEKELISVLLEEEFLSDLVIHRELASYAITDEMEKDKVILDLMKVFWAKHSPNDLFKVFRDFDTFFAALGKRGHFIHQFEVFLLGWYLMKRVKDLAPVSLMFSNSGKAQEIFSTWLITATAHDFGYPLTVASDVIITLANLYNKLGANNVARKYRSIQKKAGLMAEADLIDIKTVFWGCKKNKVDIRKLISAGIAETLGSDEISTETVMQKLEGKENNGQVNHGYVSAILICNAYIKKLPDSLPKRRVSRILNQLKLASAAIALHAAPPGLNNEIGKIAFSRNPYAYILFMVDNLQDWSRNLRPNEKYPSYNLLGIEFSAASNEIMIRYVLTHSKWTHDIEKRLAESLSEKKSRLQLLPAISTPGSFRVCVNFATNHGITIDPLTIEI